MALPVTLTGPSFVATQSNHRPFLDGNNNVYGVFRDVSDLTQIEVWKNTDPDVNNFAEIDAADKPDAANDYGAVASVHKGTKLHIVSQFVTAGTRNVQYHEFGMSDNGQADQWITTHEAVATVDDVTATYGVAIDLRSDNDRIVLHQGPTENVKGTKYTRIVYSRWEGASWTSNVAVSATGAAENYEAAACVMDSTDRCHFFYRNATTTTAYHRSLDSSNSLDTAESIGVGGGGASAKLYINPVAIDDGADVRVRFAAVDGFFQPVLVRIDNNGTPATTTGIAGVAIDGHLAMSLAADGADLHLLYADDSTNDLWQDQSTTPHTTWGTDTEILDAVGITQLFSNIYRREGADVHGYFYLDAGTLKYNERTLAVANDGGSLGTGNAKTASSTFSFNTGISVTAGQLVVLIVATDNNTDTDGDNNEHQTVTIDGNSMIQALEYTNSEAAADAGVTTSVWYWLATTDVTAAVAVITSLSAGKTAKAATGHVIDLNDGYTVSVDGTQTGGTTAADPESLTATGSVDDLHIWFRGIGAEDNHADVGTLTPTSGWTALAGDGTEGGVSDTNISVRGEFKIASGTSSGASNPSIVSTPDTASVLVGLLISPPAETLSPTAIATEESFGTAKLNATIAPSAITTGESVPTPALRPTISAVAIATQESFGTAQLNSTVYPSPVATGESFGTATVSGGVETISPSLVASGESFGTLTIIATLFPTAIATQEAFGTLVFVSFLAPTAIATEESFGTLTLVATLAPTAIGTEEAFGSHQLNSTITATSAHAGETFGTAVLVATIFPATVTTGESFGTLTLTSLLSPSPISTGETFGTHQLNSLILPIGVSSGESFGTAVMVATLGVDAIVTGESFGTAALLGVISPDAITTGEAFGALVLLATISPDGIATGEAFGTLTVMARVPIYPGSVTTAVLGQAGVTVSVLGPGSVVAATKSSTN